MKLTEKPDYIQFPEIHYVFTEAVGPFLENAPAAWGKLHKNVDQIAKQGKINGYMSLYKIEPQMLYRAGVALDRKPEKIPEGFKYEKFTGGKYARFVLTGSYSQLPEACGQVFRTVAQTKIPVEPNFFIENYVNDPRVTPEDQLVTEILIPTK